ncbi:hypothetical protein [Hyphomicrobium sp.]|uniref:hypothetical protein n=1 Tax=Hyphomicrobium sp. TaxID=82 RepID=UPI0025BB3A36|nr:hypothetical protein [Hyphomicrobium sp.]MCC7251181.1 hypothetical protein [Hyphomicrobium sp.]
MFLRLLVGTSTIFISLILGAFALAVVGYNSPETLSTMLAWARDLKGVITSTGIDPKYNIWVELLLEERQLLFMFFTIAARILLALLAAPFMSR